MSINHLPGLVLGFPGGTSGKEPACQCRRRKRCGFDPWVGKIPWRRKWRPTPVLLPGESHGQRSLTDYNPWGRKGSDTTEGLSLSLSSALGASQVALVVKNPPANAGDIRDSGSIPGSGRSLGGRHSNPLQNYILAWSIPMDRGA